MWTECWRISEKSVHWMSKRTFEEELAVNGSFIFKNEGDSMYPLIRQGKDLLIISGKPQGRLKKYDVPLYRRDNGRVVLHRILKVREKDYVICGDHNWRREYGIKDDQIIGVLTAFVRDGVETPVTDKRYLAYVHLWCDLYYIRAAILWGKSLLWRIKRKLTK